MECLLKVLEDLEANEAPSPHPPPSKQKFMLGYIMLGESLEKKKPAMNFLFTGTKNMVLTDCLSLSQKHFSLLSVQKL